jgi:hypothetical protein
VWHTYTPHICNCTVIFVHDFAFVSFAEQAWVLVRPAGIICVQFRSGVRELFQAWGRIQPLLSTEAAFNPCYQLVGLIQPLLSTEAAFNPCYQLRPHSTLVINWWAAFNPCYQLVGRKVIHEGNLMKRHGNSEKKECCQTRPTILQTDSHIA